MRGKPEAFSEAENRVLRAALRKLKEDRGLSQAALGRLLGIAQQNAGRLVGSSPNQGMSRITANNLARVLGYRDAEDLLLASGVLAAMNEPPSGAHWGDRDVAVRIARKIGIDEAAVHNVVTRYTAPDYRAKPIKWWIHKFGAEEVELVADRTQVPPARSDAPPVRRRSGTDE